MDRKTHSLGKYVVFPVLLLSLFISGVSVSYAIRAGHRNDQLVVDLQRRVAELERRLGEGAGDPGEPLLPSEPTAFAAPSEPISAPESGPAAPEAWEHLPEWVARENPRDLKSLAVAVELEGNLVLGLRVRGTDGYLVGLSGEDRRRAEELLDLLHEHHRFRNAFILDALVTGSFSAAFDNEEAATAFARRHNPSAVEAIDDGRFVVIDLTPYHSEPSTLYNSDRRNELASLLDAHSTTLVSFERNP